MALLQLKNNAWYAVFSVGRKRSWRRIGKMSKTAAKEVLKKLETQWDKKQHGVVEIKKISFPKLSEVYLDYS